MVYLKRPIVQKPFSSLVAFGIMEQWKNSVAIVTGASTGIGAAVTKDLLEAGIIVVGMARNIDRLHELRSNLTNDQQKNFHIKICDVADADTVKRVFATIISDLGGIDILINNAGCMRTGQLTTLNVTDMQEVVQTNIMGAIHCTQCAFKSMLDRNVHGHVILINSIFGHNVAALPGRVPQLNIYPATKFALTAINEIYRQEFKGLGTKVKVTSISPGLVNTNLISDEHKKVCGDAILQPEDISNAIIFALATPPRVQIHDIIIKPLGEII